MTTWWPERSLPDDIDARIETCIEIAVKSPEYNIDPVMAISFAYQESKFDATAVSPVGAIGPLQYMPNSWRCIRDENDQCDHILTGLSIMRYYIDRPLNSSNGNPAASSAYHSVNAQACLVTNNEDFYLHESMTRYVCHSCPPGPSRFSRSRMERYEFFQNLNQKYWEKASYIQYFAQNVSFFIHSRTPFSLPG